MVMFYNYVELVNRFWGYSFRVHENDSHLQLRTILNNQIVMNHNYHKLASTH